MTDTEPRGMLHAVSVGNESTVVAEYVAPPSSEEGYQSEAALEAQLISHLRSQAYEYLPLASEAELTANLRRQLGILNDIEFTDSEWKGFFDQVIASSRDGIIEKTRRIQRDPVQLLRREDGTVRNVRLVDVDHIHNNRLQVINQYVPDGAARANRYDVTILVNGLPMVHVELKRRGVDLREAFNQIRRYERDSFWAGSGLFDYVQLFVISNGTLTKYYSNTTRRRHVESDAPSRGSRRITSNSYEFTSWWADATNKRIADLTDFTRTFFAPHTLLNVLLRYCVLDVDDQLLVMRPYQIAAVEKILTRITVSTTYRQLGTRAAGGYVWHTTGSGKTLTSFKAAQMATQMEGIDKVLFVVDRKDLDYQTMREYERFQAGSANSNTSTAILRRQLGDPKARIIITTIQKLSRFVATTPQHPVYGQHVVLVFDECHRSQFGQMHADITKAFRSYHLFGFTGTPIFTDNAGGGAGGVRTTEQVFGERLHTYTIVDAINDHNVLPFRVDYHNTIRSKDGVADKEVAAIDTEAALMDDRRLREIAAYVLEHFGQKTKRQTSYQLKEQRVLGFNSIFATSSIEAAKKYYRILRDLQDAVPEAQRLRIALVYSYAANEDEPDGLLAEEGFETDSLDASSRDFLEGAIQDYNRMFSTAYSTAGDDFQNYYKDVCARLRNRDLDMVIVVNMLLTGFDATTLNTLWVDKNLKDHGLIQAFSRTNRILNSVKTYGNIVCFRNLEEATNKALALFGNRDAQELAVLKPYGHYRGEYGDVASRLLGEFPLGEPIVGETAEKAFISLFGRVLKLRNILTAFDEFDEDDPLSERARQDYQSIYLDLHQKYAGSDEADREPINQDVVFEIELVKQVEVTVDYILMLVAQYLQEKGEPGDVEVRAKIERAVESSPNLRNKKDLIDAFVESLTVGDDVEEKWTQFVHARRDAEIRRIITEELLRRDPTLRFMEDAFRDGAVPTSGTAITKILPPTPRFGPGRDHATRKSRVIQRLQAFFERYRDLG